MHGRKIYEFVLNYVPLAMKHCFVRVHCGKGVAVDLAEDSMAAGFARGMAPPEKLVSLRNLLYKINRPV